MGTLNTASAHWYLRRNCVHSLQDTAPFKTHPSRRCRSRAWCDVPFSLWLHDHLPVHLRAAKRSGVCAAGSSREQIAEELANAAPLEQATLDMGRPVDAEKEAEPYKAAEAATGTLPSKDVKKPVQMEQD